MTYPIAASPDDPRYHRHNGLHVPASEGTHRWVSGDVYTVKLNAEQTAGQVGLIEATVPPGGGPTAHAHNTASEMFYLLSGELQFTNGDEKFVAGPGDTIWIPAGERHGFLNVGRHTARMLFLFTPGGQERSIELGGDEAIPRQPAPIWGPAEFAAVVERTRALDLHSELLPDLP
jgi:quercetin dioxygenase-like cupin family protein